MLVAVPPFRSPFRSAAENVAKDVTKLNIYQRLVAAMVRVLERNFV
jgi:hypothetical protein